MTADGAVRRVQCAKPAVSMLWTQALGGRASYPSVTVKSSAMPNL